MTRKPGPLVSIVLPVRNEERYLRECLLSVANQDCDPRLYEVVVVDGESDDRTRATFSEVAESRPNLRIVSNPGRTVSCGRNVGIHSARTEIVAFVEGHAFVGPDFVSTVARAFADETVLCLGRYVEQRILGDSAIQQATGLLRKSPLGRNPHSRRFTHGGGIVDPLSVATVYRLEVFDRVGLFDEAFTTNEDVEFNWRVREAGIRALQLPSLTYHLHPRATLGGYARQMYRYGYGKAQFVRRHPRAFRSAYALPTVTLALGLAGAVLPHARVCLTPLLAYLTASAITALMWPARCGRKYPGLRLLLSLLMLAGFGLGFLWGAVHPPRAGRGGGTGRGVAAHGAGSASCAAKSAVADGEAGP